MPTEENQIIKRDYRKFNTKDMGGGALYAQKKSSKFWTYQEINKFPGSTLKQFDIKDRFLYQGHSISNKAVDDPNVIIKNVPLDILAKHLFAKELWKLALLHGLPVQSRSSAAEVQKLVKSHIPCDFCLTGTSIFQRITSCKPAKKNKAASRPQKDKDGIKQSKASAKKKKHGNSEPQVDEQMTVFPPHPIADNELNTIIRGFCNDIDPDMISESGCAICGQLTKMIELVDLQSVDVDLNILSVQGVTRLERFSETEDVREMTGPIIDDTCKHMCQTCLKALDKGEVPANALANGNWIGKVPQQLKDLQWAEQRLISRIYTNKFVARVGKGYKSNKMTANVIAFSVPMPKVYNALPPSPEELDNVFAFIYTGPTKPTVKEYRRTPFLVRRQKVVDALEWLKLNHIDYADLDISYSNLQMYPENEPPVTVDYRPSWLNKNSEATSIDDQEEEDGTTAGPCKFLLHGLTGGELVTKTSEQMRAIAVGHLLQGGTALGIGHNDHPESMYHNPQLYPQIFPWLFPYGLGGMGNQRGTGISDARRKKNLLMYHDKRFQLDQHFPLLAFNHEQIKNASTGGFLLANRNTFPEIANRLMTVDEPTLNSLIERLSAGEKVKPITQEEKQCYRILNDLDHVAGHVDNSNTTRKFMRNEIWSLVSYLGSPSWFITFAPADIQHPIALYFADTKESLKPCIRQYDEKLRLIANNPVAGARFFKLMVDNFIKHILGIDSVNRGLYGKSSGYYGTVEQQGRLTLHMHMLVWIANSPTPQEIRDKIMDPTSDFQMEMVKYIESCQVGEFLTGKMEDIRQRLDKQDEQFPDSPRPQELLPESPPEDCQSAACNKNCSNCKTMDSWWDHFKCTVDELIFRLNRHTCRQEIMDENGKKKRSGCIHPKYGSCKARFPRDTFIETCVDPNTGALNMKKGEAFINDVTPAIIYTLRCNSDTTSLLSGTAVKAVIAYVTDYVTKSALKTPRLFDTIKGVLSRNNELLGGSEGRHEAARKVFTQVVNSLTSQSEIGAPMACMYLLGHKDHYTSHSFKTFYWPAYVNEAMSAWPEMSEKPAYLCPESGNKVVVAKGTGKKYIGTSAVQDYIYRPLELEDVCLYDWMRCAIKTAKRKPKKEVFLDPIEEHSDTDRESVMEDGCQAEEMPGILLSDHPQSDSHCIHFLPEKRAKVPNFVGGILPRYDQGNREKYCSTMLVIFKPWRSGKDLKSEVALWDDAFQTHPFSDRQKQVMKFFNLRYECTDSRDDYSAKRKAGLADDLGTPFMSNKMLDELDDEKAQHDLLGQLDEAAIDAFLSEDWDQLGHGTIRCMNAMADMDRTLRMSGWLDDKPTGFDSMPQDFLMTDEAISPSQWKIRLEAAKDQVLEQKDHEIQQKAPPNETGHNSEVFKPNVVKEVNYNYLNRKFKAEVKEAQVQTDSISKSFQLNTEQDRAFRIVANHAVQNTGDQLKLYLGGMAGTGKSQVIKAISAFFKLRNESYRFMLMAPTGSAAALISGSTYHSVLGINGRSSNTSVSSLAKIRSRLQHVEYLFLDEVSMVSCEDLYQISAQLCLALNRPTDAFGGMNLILAGDFAQLPPVLNSPLYSHKVGTCADSRVSKTQEKATIGKSLWHEFVHVVILRENMRQRSQSDDDKKLRKALENMRYKSCTDADISLLNTRLGGRSAGRPKFNDSKFRDVSVITAWNAHRDTLNELGSLRFAADHKQELVIFYSRDQWKAHSDEDSKTAKRMKRKLAFDPIRDSDQVRLAFQDRLWNLPHCATEHHAGKLALCIGMPVMIKQNQATECCVTNGAEGTVVGWRSSALVQDKLALDIVFVQLTDPPIEVKIDGLPCNVVPISAQTVEIMCRLPNDKLRKIKRCQVPLLPNFGMTDYASQGRTRKHNIMDLTNSKTFQSIYTAISRGSTLDGTIFLQRWDTSKVKGGAPGNIRQEFRELEILDEITKMRWLGTLPPKVSGHRRYTLIQEFCLWKGKDYVPAKVHRSLKWTSADPLNLADPVIYSPWKMIQSTKDINVSPLKKDGQSVPSYYVPAKGTTRLLTLSNDTGKPVNRKRKKNIDDINEPRKRQKNDHVDPVATPTPIGFIWDRDAYSCAYDSLFCIFLSMWKAKPIMWHQQVACHNSHLDVLVSGFSAAKAGTISWERARNRVRESLYKDNRRLFPIRGAVGILIADLADALSKHTSAFGVRRQSCEQCAYTRNPIPLKSCFLGLTHDVHVIDYVTGTQDWVAYQQQHYHIRRECPNCNSLLNVTTEMEVIPAIFLVDVAGGCMAIDKKISLKGRSETKSLKLRGVVYHGSEHFVSRIIEKHVVWYNDGIETGRSSLNEGRLADFDSEGLRTCQGKIASLAIYGQ